MKQRSVFRVGGAYLVVGWVIIQIVDIAVPALLLPEWVNSFVFLLIMIGLPVALILAYAFEITPEGIRKQSDLGAPQESGQTRARVNDYVVMGAMVIISGFLGYQWFAGDSDPLAGVGSADRNDSIAVLPFANLADTTAYGAFVQAVTERTMTELSTLEGIRVASRTSSFQFQGQGLGISEIGAALDVAVILEGSVQVTGSDMRISAQLVDVDTGYTIWSATYDQGASVSLAVQDQMSRRIVAAIRPYLASTAVPVGASPAELVADGWRVLRSRRAPATTEARNLFQRAVDGDHDFAAGFAGLGATYLLEADSPETYGELDMEDAIAMARPLVERAVALDRLMGSVQAVKGLLTMAIGQPADAIVMLQQATAIDPDFVDGHVWLYQVYRQLGQPKPAGLALKRAFALDPDSLVVGLNMAGLLSREGRAEEVDILLRRLERAHPENDNIAVARALALATGGRYAESNRILAEAFGRESAPEEIRHFLALNYRHAGAADAAAALSQRAAIKPQSEVEPLAVDLSRPEPRYVMARALFAGGLDQAVIGLLEPFIVGVLSAARNATLEPDALVLAAAYQRLGRNGDAAALIARVKALAAAERTAGRTGGDVAFLAAKIQALEGNADEALVLLDTAIDAGFSSAALVADAPALYTLQGTEAFTVSLAELARKQADERVRMAAMGLLDPAGIGQD